ncbi:MULTISPECIES: hypothetical protein [unclassified Caballeronia]|uniref:hypothetical protein n=1 Tax=unclassified Caballeronia TaxID=2646786 RepID=UPI0028647F43|nr:MULTISPECIES: hypothetical protein [unclassified Caballeronia]MDR5750234.1 hypothetical protein [Caballeronia sp. LZ024]MDR5842637.1 hypothetical protein [Caballeronia sp. LZ031]
MTTKASSKAKDVTPAKTNPVVVKAKRSTRWKKDRGIVVAPPPGASPTADEKGLAVGSVAQGGIKPDELTQSAALSPPGGDSSDGDDVVMVNQNGKPVQATPPRQDDDGVEMVGQAGR